MVTSTMTNLDNGACEYCGTPLWMFISITTATVSVLGNVLTICAILLSKRLSSILANYFVFSLAVSDCFVGCFIPYHMLFYMVDGFGRGKSSCLLRFVLTSFACSSSICNILFIAMDRYVAVVYPLHYTKYMTRKAAFLLIGLGWLTATSLAAVPVLWNDWQEGVECEWADVMPSNFIKFILCPMFVLIWTTMVLLYSKICREASGQMQRLRGSLPSGINHVTSLKDSKSFQMMLIILGCFTICWLPYFAITIYARTVNDFGHRATPYEISFNLAMANSSMNPLIYAWKNSNFRSAFLRLAHCQRPDDHGCRGAKYITDHVPHNRNSINGLCKPPSRSEDDDEDTSKDLEMRTCVSTIESGYASSNAR